MLTVEDTAREDGTPVISEKDIQDDRDEGYDEDMIQQEYFCSFEGGLAGAYYGRLMAAARKDGRVTKVPHNPDIPVYTFWDIGVSDSTTIWFIQIPNNYSYNVIRYYENNNEGMAFYIKYLDKLRVEESYSFAEHFGPHDIDRRGFATAEYPLQIARNLNYEFTVVERSHNIQHGIGNVRSLIPKCHFDADGCDAGIDALESYHKEWDGKWKRYSDTPVRDWATHGADGFRTFGEGVQLISSGPGVSEAEIQRMKAKARGDDVGGPLDDYFDEPIEF